MGRSLAGLKLLVNTGREFVLNREHIENSLLYAVDCLSVWAWSHI